MWQYFPSFSKEITHGAVILNICQKLMSLLAVTTITVSTLILGQYIFKKAFIFKKKNLLASWKYFRFSVNWRKQQWNASFSTSSSLPFCPYHIFFSHTQMWHTHIRTHTQFTMCYVTPAQTCLFYHTQGNISCFGIQKCHDPPWKLDSVYKKPAGGLFSCWSVVIKTNVCNWFLVLYSIK